MEAKLILLVVGGAWHPFQAFAEFARLWGADHGYAVRVTEDFDDLLRLGEIRPGIVLLYTSLGGAVDNRGHVGMDFSSAQALGLAQWVRAGGACVAIHSATVAGPECTTIKSLIGGRFVSHPPPGEFTVVPGPTPHPITDGVSAFTVHDEFYIQEYADDIAVLMTAHHEGRDYPYVWARTDGEGRVAYLGVGHFPEIWSSGPFKRLLLQAHRWVSP